MLLVSNIRNGTTEVKREEMLLIIKCCCTRDRMAPEGMGSCQALFFLLKHLSQKLGIFARMENRRFLHQEKAILRG